MKLIALFAITASLNAFASTPASVCADEFGYGTVEYKLCLSGEFNEPKPFAADRCDELYDQGDMRGYEDCVSSFPYELSMPVSWCDDVYGEGTEAAEKCKEPQFSIPFSTPVPACETLPEPQKTFCEEGQFGEPAPLSMPLVMCKKFISNPTAYKACMNGEYN